MPARGTSQRSFVNPFGAMHIPFVEEGNLCIARSFVSNLDEFFFNTSRNGGATLAENIFVQLESEGCDALIYYISSPLLLSSGASSTNALSKKSEMGSFLQLDLLCFFPCNPAS